jgi:hypothetical protein
VVVVSEGASLLHYSFIEANEAGKEKVRMALDGAARRYRPSQCLDNVSVTRRG